MASRSGTTSGMQYGPTEHIAYQWSCQTLRLFAPRQNAEYVDANASQSKQATPQRDLDYTTKASHTLTGATFRVCKPLTPIGRRG